MQEDVSTNYMQLKPAALYPQSVASTPPTCTNARDSNALHGKSARRKALRSNTYLTKYEVKASSLRRGGRLTAFAMLLAMHRHTVAHTAMHRAYLQPGMDKCLEGSEHLLPGITTDHDSVLAAVS